jgi:hypothetical protein
MDSRLGLNATVLRADVPQGFQMAGKFGIAADAIAITGTLTIASPTRPGYVQLSPVRSGAPSVATSTLNFPTNDPRAAGVTEPLGSDGKIWALYHTGRRVDTVHVIFDLTGYYSSDAGGLTFGPVGPVRAVDSRNNTGGATALASDVAESFQIAGQSGVPADALVVAGTLSIANPTQAGYIALTPVETTPETNTTSTLNFTARDPRATSVTMPLGPDGKLWALYHTSLPGTVDIILDITGYFSSATDGARFHRLGPARIVDSRTGTGARMLGSDQPQSLTLGGVYGIPADVVAVTGTLTAANQTYPGDITLTPGQIAPAAASTVSLTFATNDPRATGVIEPVGADGQVWALYRTGRPDDHVHLIFDVTGYFAPDPAGLQLMPAYFDGSMPNDSLARDANGVILARYSWGTEYNPVTIEQAALRYYDRWLIDTTDEKKAADHDAMFAQVNWLMANQSSDGRWFYQFRWGSQPRPWWSGLAEGQGISVLLRAYSMTRDAAYLTAIARARATFERPQASLGVQKSFSYKGTYVVYEEYLVGGCQNVLNGWMFALVALYEDAVYLDDPMASWDLMAADRGVGALRAMLPLYDSGGWSYYNRLSAASPGSYASSHYHQVHIQELRFLNSVTGDPTLLKYADRFQGYLSANAIPATDATDDPNDWQP